MQLPPILERQRFDKSQQSETLTSSEISLSSLAEEYDHYFVWYHVTKPYQVKQEWQKKEESIFEWFRARGVRLGDPESIKQLSQGQHRKNIAIKTQQSHLSSSENMHARRLKTKLTITL